MTAPVLVLPDQMLLPCQSRNLIEILIASAGTGMVSELSLLYPQDNLCCKIIFVSGESFPSLCEGGKRYFRFFCQRECEREYRTFSFFTFYPNPPMMLLNNLCADKKSDTQPPGRPVLSISYLIQPLKNFLLVLFLNTNSFIYYTHQGM